MSVTVRVAEPLRFLLSTRHRSGVALVEASHVGQVIESLGVPRTEIGPPLVNGRPSTLDTLLSDGDVVDVPARPRPQPLTFPRFVLDVHLGTLARRLRLLGVDVAYRNDADDDELVAQARDEQRILLTQDRGLLRRRALIAGGYVRGSRPDDQLTDVLERFAPPLDPWTRCPACNGSLSPVAKGDVADRLPEGTRRSYDAFSQCGQCERVYWRGAHTTHLTSIVSTHSA